jgi:hypothetical protein
MDAEFDESDILQRVRDQRCLACGSLPSDPHHLITRGAGGKDEIDNIMPLCRRHHTEVHQIGLVKMSHKYVLVEEWLDDHGWILENIGVSKWRNYGCMP